jgi:glycosyltransferase involved in cell wall biosynthesis
MLQMSSIPKVLFVVNSISGGGAENSAFKVYSELKKQGINIELIALNQFEGVESSKDDRVHLLDRRWSDGLILTIRNYLEFIKKVWVVDPKIVVAHCELPELYIALIPRRYLSLIVVEHTTDPWSGRKLLGVLVRSLLKLKRTSWVTVTSTRNSVWLGAKQPIRILNPVSSTKDTPADKFKEKFVYIGRLRNEKRPEWAIISTIANNTPIAMIGEGYLAKQLQDKYHSQKDQVTFYGFIDNPWSRLKRDALVIMPSEYEGDGLVAIEAIINGFAIVLADNPDLRRLNLPERNYFRTPDDLSRIIAESLTTGTKIFLPPASTRDEFESLRRPENIALEWLHLLQVVTNRR